MRLPHDTRRLLLAQGLRAFVYGFGSVLLGTSLAAGGLSNAEVGVVFTAIVAGMAVSSALVGAVGDRLGRRRVYAGLFAAMALSGAVFAVTDHLWALIAIALAGTLSTDAQENGPFTSLEQSMLPVGLEPRARTRIFGTYNVVAALAGSMGALAAGGPGLLRHLWAGVPADRHLFLVFVPAGLAGAALALRLSPRVEASPPRRREKPLQRSRGAVAGLAALFAADSFAGGFVVQSFIAYWLHQRFGASLDVLGVIFFAIGILQAGSYVVAVHLAERIGLLETMVLSHLPSNVLLALLPVMPSLPAAVLLLLARSALSRMDVPTRQAYLVALVDPSERTAAAAYTNTARNAVRPLGPVLGGLSQQLALGVPFVIAGGLKCAYDVAIWSWFRRIPLHHDAAAGPAGSAMGARSHHR